MPFTRSQLKNWQRKAEENLQSYIDQWGLDEAGYPNHFEILKTIGFTKLVVDRRSGVLNHTIFMKEIEDIINPTKPRHALSHAQKNECEYVIAFGDTADASDNRTVRRFWVRKGILDYNTKLQLPAYSRWLNDADIKTLLELLKADLMKNFKGYEREIREEKIRATELTLIWDGTKQQSTHTDLDMKLSDREKNPLCSGFQVYAIDAYDLVIHGKTIHLLPGDSYYVEGWVPHHGPIQEQKSASRHRRLHIHWDHEDEKREGNIVYC